jgi:AcrR family transcriptional regulator
MPADRTPLPAPVPAARAPKLRAAPRGDRVREAILDCAEQLFAERGFHGTSIREITERAGLRLAAVNYHFGTKEGLFRDVLLRRAAPLNARRLELLAAVSKAGTQRARVRAVVEAFVCPVAELAREGEGPRRYLTLIAQVSSSRLLALALVAEHFNHVAERFVDALARIFPGTREAEHLHAYQLMLGATLFSFSGNLRMESLAKQTPRPSELDALSGSVIAFAVAGVEAVLSSSRRPKRR